LTTPYRSIHDDPAHGGLAVLWNLKCLCRFHQLLKPLRSG
jgi:hypothetical protein